MCLLGLVIDPSSRLHLLGVVVGAIGTGSHHAAHAWNCITCLLVALHGRTRICRSRQLCGIDIVGHSIRFICHHIVLASRNWGCRNGRCYHGHNIASLLGVRYEHGYHATRRQELLLSTILWVIKWLRHSVTLGLEGRLLKGLESRSMNCSFRYV